MTLPNIRELLPDAFKKATEDTDVAIEQLKNGIRAVTQGNITGGIYIIVTKEGDHVFSSAIALGERAPQYHGHFKDFFASVQKTAQESSLACLKFVQENPTPRNEPSLQKKFSELDRQSSQISRFYQLIRNWAMGFPDLAAIVNPPIGPTQKPLDFTPT